MIFIKLPNKCKHFLIYVIRFRVNKLKLSIQLNYLNLVVIGNMFYPTQIFNQYSNGIFQNLTDVQTFQPYMSPNQDVQQTIPPDQDVQETTICIPPHQDVQQTTSSDTSDDDTGHQTWQRKHKIVIK